jgi:hypothetical protein
MTEARRKAKIAMLQKGITVGDLCKATGLSKAAIHNLLSDTSAGQKSRQALTNALQTQLWPDIKITETTYTIKKGMLIHWPSNRETAEFLDEFGSAAVAVRNNLIEIIRDLPLRISLASEAREAAAAPSDKTDRGTEVWGPSDKKEALAAATNLAGREKLKSS